MRQILAVSGLLALSVAAVGTASAQPVDRPAWSCSFQRSIEACGLHQQGRDGGRAQLLPRGRDDGGAVLLHTEPGDDRVNGSGNWERNDLLLPPSAAYCNEGQEEWWAHSVLFPGDFIMPRDGGVVMDFHHNASSGQANFELQTIAGIGLRFRGYGGARVNEGQFTYGIEDPFGAARGTVARNVWYDFVYHVRWSSGSGGYVEAWVNGRRVMRHRGPTLYAGISCYLKIANYHAPHGQPSFVVHDRVLRGSSAAAVALGPLEGVPETEANRKSRGDPAALSAGRGEP